jgi:hypothetical protein
MGYFERAIDEQLNDYLDAFGAVSIEGPKWCGKTPPLCGTPFGQRPPSAAEKNAVFATPR